MNTSFPRSRFVVIGAQKARSTYLYTAIRQHPEAFGPPGELDDFEGSSWQQRMAAFDARFTQARPGQAIGFKRPELLARPECPARLASTWPEARLLAVLREPIARTVSAYFHYVRAGWLPLRPLNAGLRSLLDGRAATAHGCEILDYSLYGAQLDRYAEHFDRSQILTLLDSDLDEPFDETMTAVFHHLLLRAEQVPRPARGTNEGVYAMTRLRLLRLGTRALYTTDRETGKMRVVRHVHLGRAANRAVHETDRRLLARFVAPEEPQLDTDVRARLVERFEPDVRRLESIMGRPLPAWPDRGPDPAAAS